MAKLASSLEDIVGVARKVLAVTSKYSDGLHDVPKEIASLTSNLESLVVILLGIQEDDTLNDMASRKQSLLPIRFEPIIDCELTLMEIRKIVERCQASSSAKKRSKWGMHRHRMAVLMRQLDRHKATIQMAFSRSNNSKLLAMATSDRVELDRHGILDWLSSYDFEARHLDLQAARLEGTCEWFLQCEEFHQWDSGSRDTPRLLWLGGRIGVGKSTLCSFVIDTLRQKRSYDGVAYIYFDYRDYQVQSKQNVLRIILRQLASQSKDLPGPIWRLWDDFGRQGIFPTYSALRHAFRDVFGFSVEPRVSICLDGIDQVNNDYQPSIMELLQDLSLEPWAHILVTSRSFREVTDFTYTRVMIEANIDDTDHFIRKELGKSRRLQSAASLRQKLFETLSPFPEGMFLAVALQVDEVLKQRSPKMMRIASNVLPSKLAIVYRDAIDRFAAHRPHQYDIAKVVFALMLNATRPLQYAEIQGCLAILQGDNPNDEEAMTDIEYIIDCCADLVFVNTANETLLFCHSTARAFLLDLKDVQEQSINAHILNNQFPGLFALPSNMKTGNKGRENTEELEDGGSVYGSDVFSQFTTDETLVPSIRADDQSQMLSLTTLRAISVPEQLVKLLLTDPSLPGLVNSVIERVGVLGFERAFSGFLKRYSGSLEAIAVTPSQKVAAVLAGQATQRTSSLLCSAVRPEDTEVSKRRILALKIDSGNDAAVDRWLEAQHTGSTVASAIYPSSSKISSKKSEHLASRPPINDPQDQIPDESDDEALYEKHFNLNSVKHFLIDTPPFMELIASLTQHLFPELHQAKPGVDDVGNALKSNPHDQLRLRKTTIVDIWCWVTRRFKIITCLIIPIFVFILCLGSKHAMAFGTMICGFGLFPLVLRTDIDRDKRSILPPMANRTQLRRIWTHILNYKEKVTDLLDRRKPTENGDLKYFQWTCSCGCTFNEKVRELVPGAADEWVLSMQSSSLGSQGDDKPTTIAGPSNSSSNAKSKGKDESHIPPRAETGQSGKSSDSPGSDTGREVGTKQPNDEPSTDEFILLCVKQGPKTTRLFADNIKTKTTDQQTFKSIRTLYNASRSSWWRLNTLSHIEFKKFQLYLSDYVDVGIEPKEQIPICDIPCEEGCGNGCQEYWYTPPKNKIIPPVPRKAMLHFLQNPECLGTQRANRDALPKRRETLELGEKALKEGWGLYFREKVWRVPIVVVQACTVVAASVGVTSGILKGRGEMWDLCLARLVSASTGRKGTPLARPVPDDAQIWKSRNEVHEIPYGG